MKVIIDHKYRWLFSEKGDIRYWSVGAAEPVSQVISSIIQKQGASIGALKNEIINSLGNYAFIIEGGDWIIASVDRLRSFPVFYFQKDDSFAVSNSANALVDEMEISEIDELSLLEFRQSGYVTGRKTLCRNLFQLRAGEFLVWDKVKRELRTERYFEFFSEDLREETKEELINELDHITNRIFQNIMEKADGLPIWVALSGGLDSRLVLCKLKQLGYDNLHAFSYGPRGNYEAKAAEYVAKNVGVKWRFIPLLMKNARFFFRSDFRRKYWEFSWNLSSVPFTGDIQVLWENRRKGIIPKDAIIINGQSGDFITGGHIPSLEKESDYTVAEIAESIINKHFSLWINLKTVENLEQIKRKILSLLGLKGEEKITRQDFTRYYELWEWQERQSKYVVNGQRNYDFLGFRWFLPLWDDPYLFFWAKVPVHLKDKQTLYKAYLERYNFFGIFRDFPFTIWRWPGATIAFVPGVRILKFLFGHEFGDQVYKILAYWGHCRDLYAQYGFRTYLKDHLHLRNFHSLNSRQLLWESGFLGSEEI